MADIVCESVCCSDTLVNSQGDNEMSACKMCRNYENLLKEALDELNSVHTINRLLQKELLACMAHTTTWGIELHPTKKDSDQAGCSAWSLEITKNHMNKTKKHVISNTTKTDQFIRTTNRYTLLIEVPTDEGGTIPVIVNGGISAKGSAKATTRSKSHQEASGHGETNHKKSSIKSNVRKNTSHKLNSSPQQRKKHRIIIIGVSHARGSASNMKHNLNDDFGLTGFVKPGATTDSLISSTTEDTKHLTNDDLLVFWGGTNDVSRNNSQKGLKSLTNFVEVHSHTNIILVCVPHRHDLPEWSCVNREVKTFNRKLVKLMKPYQHVTVMRVDPDRKFFTQHGLHMNNSGKERLASEIANLSANILLKHEVISLGWKNEQEDGINDGANEDSSSLREELKVTLLVTTNVEASTDELVQSGPIHMGRRISKRQKKPPVIKSDDFLW